MNNIWSQLSSLFHGQSSKKLKFENHLNRDVNCYSEEENP